jgi:hypothetical protein
MEAVHSSEMLIYINLCGVTSQQTEILIDIQIANTALGSSAHLRFFVMRDLNTFHKQKHSKYPGKMVH